ncbi:MAG: BolA family protein [Alphaproteobacteria bacterium]
MIKDIYNALQEKFENGEIKLMDFSGEHLGHGDHVKEASHLRVYIISEKFEGLSKVNRQRMVNEILSPFFNQGLHAVELYLETE